MFCYALKLLSHYFVMLYFFWRIRNLIASDTAIDFPYFATLAKPFRRPLRGLILVALTHEQIVLAWDASKGLPTKTDKFSSIIF